MTGNVAGVWDRRVKSGSDPRAFLTFHPEGIEINQPGVVPRSGKLPRVNAHTTTYLP